MTSSHTTTYPMNRLDTWQHPDSLYDEPYQPVPVEINSYQSLTGPLVVFEHDAQGVTLKGQDNMLLRMQFHDSHTARIRLGSLEHLKAASITEQLHLVQFLPAQQDCQWEQTAQYISIHTAHLTVRVHRHDTTISIHRHDGTRLLETAEPMRWSLDQPAYGGMCGLGVFHRLENEQYFGMGGRIVNPNRTGDHVDIFSMKAGIRSGDYGGFAVPFFISTRGYGVMLNNPWPHVYFDMGHSNPDQWFVHHPGGEFDLVLFDGPEFSDVMQRYSQVVGRIPIPPRWLLGMWYSSLTFRSADQAVADAQRLHQEGYPADVFVFDGPWRGGRDFASLYASGQQYPSNDMHWHEDFGDGPGMIRQLAQIGIKTALHLNSRNFSPQTTQEGLAQGYLRQQEQEVVVRVLDQQAEKRYQSHLVPRIEEGVDFWWTDHSDRVSGQIQAGLPSRNLLGPLWNRLLTDIMKSHGRNWHMSLSRGGGIGSQPYALPWPGDTRCGLDALADDFWFMLGAGLGGFPLSSADLGGFAPRKNPHKDYDSQQAIHDEMFDDQNICRRVCQSLLFTPLPRIHNNWATVPKFPWNCSEKAQPLYKRVLHERYQLTPYFYSYAVHAARTGEPILRPLAYHHRILERAVTQDSVFYIGQWLLTAPVTQEHVDQWALYLPPGQWIHLWTDERFEGDQIITVHVPLYDIQGIPLFVKAGAILPRQAMTLSLGDIMPQDLSLDIYPCGTTEIALHESADITHVFRCKQEPDQTTVHLPNHTQQPRTYTLIMHHMNQARRVTVNGAILPTEKRTINTQQKTFGIHCTVQPDQAIDVIFHHA